MVSDQESEAWEAAPDDDEEAGEADGVATMVEPAESSAEMQELDHETLDGLDEQERQELETSMAEAGGPTQLSANFALAEFHCCRGHCPKEAVPAAAVPALRRLVTQVLQPMRNRFGVATVLSGYRNAAHNGHVGGASQSHHRYDQRPSAPAADVMFASGSVNEWAAEARRLLGNSIGGIGRYPTSGFVHVDLGAFRKWDG